MAPRTFDQAVRFLTDAAGLERLLRLIQSILQITSFYPWAFGLLISLQLLLGTSPGPDPASKHPIPGTAQTHAILLALRGRANLARRFLRAFRFLEAFGAAHKLYASAAGPDLWLDVLAKTFNGLYLALETATLPDALGVDGFRVWSPERERALNLEGQRFWFLALACGVLASTWRLLRLSALAPVPATGEGFGLGQAAATEDEKDALRELDDKDGDDDEKDPEKEREKLRERAAKRKAELARRRKEVRARSGALLWKIAAEGLDMILPGAVVGWIGADAGTVGLAMFVTTILTGWDVWDRCGREVQSAQ